MQWGGDPVNRLFQEEVNEPTVQYVGGGFGPPKTEDIE